MNEQGKERAGVWAVTGTGEGEPATSAVIRGQAPSGAAGAAGERPG